MIAWLQRLCGPAPPMHITLFLLLAVIILQILRQCRVIRHSARFAIARRVVFARISVRLLDSALLDYRDVIGSFISSRSDVRVLLRLVGVSVYPPSPSIFPPRLVLFGPVFLPLARADRGIPPICRKRSWKRRVLGLRECRRRCHDGIGVLLRRELIARIGIDFGVSVFEIAVHEVVVTAGALRIQLLLDSAVQHRRLGDGNRLRVWEHLSVAAFLWPPDVDGPVDHRHRVAHLARGLDHGRDVTHGIQARINLIAVRARERAVRGNFSGALRTHSPRFLLLLPRLLIAASCRAASSRCFSNDRRWRLTLRLQAGTGVLRMVVSYVPIQVVFASELRLAVLAGERLLV